MKGSGCAAVRSSSHLLAVNSGADFMAEVIHHFPNFSPIPCLLCSCPGSTAHHPAQHAQQNYLPDPPVPAVGTDSVLQAQAEGYSSSGSEQWWIAASQMVTSTVGSSDEVSLLVMWKQCLKWPGTHSCGQCLYQAVPTCCLCWQRWWLLGTHPASCGETPLSVQVHRGNGRKVSEGDHQPCPSAGAAGEASC